MKSSTLSAPLAFQHGPAMSNRLMLAPLTNLQSHADGRLSDDEYRWLTLRAQGGFGLTMTCASHVQPQGRGFPGQLGIFSDDCLEGLSRLASGLRAAGSLAAVQLHHAGNRAPKALVPDLVCASDDPETGARGLTTAEVEALVEDFIVAGLRAERAGFDGVEVHGAHGYILAQFLSSELNHRTDRYGGSLENRSRVIFEIIDGLRRRCGPNFQIGLRLSPERFGLQLPEIIDVAAEVLKQAKIDYLDMSLWDCGKEPLDEAFKGRSLMSCFTELDRGPVRLGVAGKIMSGTRAAELLADGADFVLIGRAAILHHDFAKRVLADEAFTAMALPVTREHLRAEGLGPAFVDYISTWPGFVAD